MATAEGVIGTHDFQIQVCEVLGLNSSRVARIIIDLDCDNYGPIPIYVEMIGDDRLLSVDWGKGLKGAEIVREPKEEATDSLRIGGARFFCRKCNEWMDTVESIATHTQCPICGTVMEKYS